MHHERTVHGLLEVVGDAFLQHGGSKGSKALAFLDFTIDGVFHARHQGAGKNRAIPQGSWSPLATSLIPRDDHAAVEQLRHRFRGVSAERAHRHRRGLRRFLTRVEGVGAAPIGMLHMKSLFASGHIVVRPQRSSEARSIVRRGTLQVGALEGRLAQKQ